MDEGDGPYRAQSESKALDIWLDYLGRTPWGDEAAFGQLCSQHPGLEAELRKLRGPGGVGLDNDASPGPPDDHSSAVDLAQGRPKPRIAHYVLERELGHGGQGRVYLAVDQHMRRQVALKVLSRARLTPDALRRFRREVEAIARLDHPGLCAVYEADLEGPRPYLAMRFVDGDDLARRLNARKAGEDDRDFVHPGGAVELAQLLQLFERAARALHAAHESGVVHRDIKPANILVRKDGEPVIVDFGLASLVDSEFPSLTRSDQVFGTPAYMAPELIESGHSSVDRRVDVYALGVALYECLTLARPFRAEHREALFLQILHGEYENPSAINPLVGEDLRVVLATAMEHEPTRRYATALEFAEELRRVRAYEPIRARPATWPVRMRRWSQRHPRIAAAAVLFFAMLGVWVATLRVTLRRVENERNTALAANRRLQGVQYREQSAERLATNPGLGLLLALEAERRAPGFASNMALLRALLQCREVRTLATQSPEIFFAVDVSPDGRQIAAATQYHGLVFDVDSCLPRLSIKAPIAVERLNNRLQVCFRPSGDSFLISGRGGPMWLMDSATGRIRRVFGTAAEVAVSAEFDAQGQRILTASLDGLARIYDVESGALFRAVEPGTGYLSIARFDPTGAWFLTAADFVLEAGHPDPSDHDPRVWDVATGELVATLRGHTRPVRDAKFAPASLPLVTTDDEGWVRAFNWRSGQEYWSARLPGQGWRIAFSPDGATVAVGFQPGVRVFATISGEHLFDLSGLSDRSVLNLGYSPNGQWIAAQDYAGNVGAWSALDGSVRFKSRCSKVGEGSLSWFPDSKRFATAARETVAHVWSPDPIPLLLTFAGHLGRVRSIAFDPSSFFVLSAGDDGVARLWSVRDGSLAQSFAFDGEPLECAWFSADGSLVGGLTSRGTVMVLDARTGECRSVRPGAGAPVTAAEVSADGNTVAFGCEDGIVSWIETATARPIASGQESPAPISRVVLSSDGWRLGWGAGDGRAGIVERMSGRRTSFDASPTNHAKPEVSGLGFSRDGLQILTSATERVHRVWSVDGGESNGSFPGHPWNQVVALTDGQAYLIATTSGAKVFRREGFLPTLIPWVYDAAGPIITGLRVSPDERYFVAASRSGVAELCQVSDGALVLRYEHGTSPLTCAEFSPDGRAVVTAAEDGSVRIWPVNVAEVARAHVPATPEVWAAQMPKALGD